MKTSTKKLNRLVNRALNTFIGSTLSIFLLMAVFFSSTSFAQDTYSVNSLGDGGAWDNPDTEDEDESIDGICDDGTGKCTLRAALEEASNREHSVTVNFSLTGTILTDGYLLIPDGSNIFGSNGNIKIMSSDNGLSGGDNITISNLVFDVFSTAIEVGSNCQITGNNVIKGMVGISAGDACTISNNIVKASMGGIMANDGNTITGNQVLSGQVGISIENTNTIGGITTDKRNIIGGCVLGISLGGSDNKVFGNYIGVGSNGISALTNSVGIVLANTGNIVGGTTPEERNIISGNTSQGIGAAGTNNIIKGNFIGLGSDGITAIPNGIGIKYDGAGVIGGDLPGERNIISANSTGISLGEDPEGNSAVVVKGNYIGTDISGNVAKGNTGAGVTITSSGHKVENNLISGNGTTGIGLVSFEGMSTAKNNVITGNKIGTNASGLSPLANAAGIIFQGPSDDNTIGEGLLAAYQGNTIAFNSGPGIFIDAQPALGGLPKGNTFRKNSIFDNGDLGIKIQSLAQQGVMPPIIDSLKNDILYGHGAIADAVIDVYETALDPSGAGEGKTWLASGIAIANGTFEISVNNPNCNPLTVTQTDLNKNTSAFSQNLELDPIIKSLNPSCSQTFLVGVTHINTFIATIDWKGTPEAGRSVKFKLNGDTHQGVLSGNSATTTYNMGAILEGNNTMEITAESCGGSSPFSYNICGTTVPEWAAPAGSIIATGASCDVRYNKVFKFPDPAIVPNMPFMSDIPFIGGALGLLSTQGQVSLIASSAGGNITNEEVELNTKFNLGGESFSLTTSGITNTNLACSSLNLDGSLTATVDVSHTYSWGTDLSSLLPVTCPTLPLLGEICSRARAVSQLASLGAEVGGSLAITANYKANSTVVFTDGSGTGSLFIRPFINVFPFSAQGRGTLSLQVNVPSFDTKGQLSLEFNVSAGPFGSRNYGPYTWATSSRQNLHFGVEETKTSELLPYKNKSYNLASDSITNNDTIIIAGIPSNGTPKVTIGPNGNRAITWSHFNAGNPRPSGDIGVKIFNGANWSPSIFLNTDIQADQNPVAAFDSMGHIIVCWERNPTTTIPADTAIYEANYLQGFNIQFAILNVKSGSVISTGSFGNANQYDFSPQLSRGTDGNVLLVWESTSGNTIYGNESDPANLNSVRWNGLNWGATSVISSSLKGVHSWESDNRNKDTSMVAMLLDTDGDLSSSSDWEVYTSLWNGTIWSPLLRITNDAAVDWGVHCTYADNGNPVIAWLRNSTVVGIAGDLTKQPNVWLDSGNNVGLEFINGKIAGGAGKMYLAWPEMGNISYSKSDIAQSIWTKRITRSTENEERYLSLDIDEKGKEFFGYLKVPFKSNSFMLSDTADFYITKPEIKEITTEIEFEAPENLSKNELMEIYPNPVNNAARINYQITKHCAVKLILLDLQGREIKKLVNEEKNSGNYEVILETIPLHSGTYILKLEAGNVVETKKIVIIK